MSTRSRGIALRAAWYLRTHRRYEVQVAVAHEVDYILVQVRDHGERLGNEVGKARIPTAKLPAGTRPNCTFARSSCTW